MCVCMYKHVASYNAVSENIYTTCECARGVLLIHYSKLMNNIPYTFVGSKQPKISRPISRSKGGRGDHA